MRDGPRPLSVHIGLAASSQPFFEHTQNTSLPYSDDASKRFEGDLKNMLLGIQKYQQHPFKPQRLKTTEVWRSGEVSLKAIPGMKYDAGPVLLLVPSLINKAYILDLMKGRSMMRWMAQQGICPHLLDWGESCEDPGQLSMESLVKERLTPAIRWLASKGDRDVHALGYCMGGTILAVACAFSSDLPVKSLVMLASPWDFHAGSRALLERVKFWAPAGYAALEAGRDLPVNWIQSVFASLDPFSSVKKFSKFHEMEDGPEAELFMAVEDWLNDGVSLPHGVALECLRDWFIENKIGSNDWVLGGNRIALQNIKKPVLVAVSKKDRLVEYEQSLPFAHQIKKAKLHVAECGHIGMIAGNRAVEEVWSHIAAWVHNVD